MSKLIEVEAGSILVLTEDDTYNWATRPRAKWPCSVTKGHRLEAWFDRQGNMIYRTLDGESDVWIPGDEFDAITTDHLPAGHPARRDWVWA